MTYLKIFFTFLKIGVMGFGGGWATVGVMKHELVTSQGLLTADQFNNVVYVIGLTPGPVAVSGSAIIGKKIAGFGGSLCAVLGIITPPILIGLTLYMILLKYGDNYYVKGFMRGLGPAIVAVVLFVVIGIGKRVFIDTNVVVILIGLAAGVCLYFDVHPILVLLGGGIAGIIFGLGG
ncbi:MAG TPA: chromate transporter [Caldisericia bacterium]|nr:chromate transporter [Caldisericia bacterium]HPF49265.1 chromate transporter [Caldisericia bacterium]HPI84055.1 chromate transporter [Caldisericia bacterium]HPQ93313.1 chromate transporter [Caldisericia bacterium]HRV75305.1 chromate transporter [Caldisericia bacterium]